MSRQVSLGALVLALISLAVPVTAQTTNGVISGIVSDAQGGVLPGYGLIEQGAGSLDIPLALAFVNAGDPASAPTSTTIAGESITMGGLSWDTGAVNGNTLVW